LNKQVKEKKINHGKKDELSVSEKAKDLQFALDLLKKVPDVRAEKIEG